MRLPESCGRSRCGLAARISCSICHGGDTWTLGLNAEYTRQSSWYRPSVSLNVKLTLSVWPNPGFASQIKLSGYKPSRTA